jgi:hypothetical protein
LIEYFYEKMKTEYKCVIAKEHQILTNDTRHLAFISLMMQGYSPIEIARLGGHQTIQAQYLYSGHKEYWVDCEVFKLMKKVKNSNIAASQTGIIPDEVKLKVFDDSGNFKRKMKIGFCKDEEQRCESKYCYFCSHWGITPEEFIYKKEKIKSDITDIKNNILELTSVIQNLNKQLLKSELSRRNQEILINIKNKSNKVQSDLYKLALLSSKLGIGEVLQAVGRNTVLSVEEVRKVIKMYKEHEKPMGNISFSEIHRYANKLYNEGIIPSTTSDSFWRKDGRFPYCILRVRGTK